MVDQNATEGDYLVRTLGEDDTILYITIVWKSNITHHKLEIDHSTGKYIINKNVRLDATTIDDVINILSNKATLPKAKDGKSWPIVLQSRIADRGRAPTPNVSLRRTSVSSRGGDMSPVRNSRNSSNNIPPTKAAPQNTFELLSPEALDVSRAPLNTLNPAIAFTLSERERISILTQDKELKRLESIETRRSAWLFRSQQAATKAWTRHAANVQTLDHATMHLATLTPIEVSLDTPSYLWDDLHKKKSDEMMAQLEDGAFLIRRKKGEDFTFLMDLKCSGVVTTHLISRVEVEQELPLEDSHTAEVAEAEVAGNDGVRKEEVKKQVVVVEGVIDMDLKEMLARITSMFQFADQTNAASGSTLPDGQLQKNEILHRLPVRPFLDLLRQSGLVGAFIKAFWYVPAVFQWMCKGLVDAPTCTLLRNLTHCAALHPPSLPHLMESG